MELTYSPRAIYWGNEALVLADISLGEAGAIQFTNAELVTGMVSVGSMEDQAETANFPADNRPDHGVKKGATLLQGEMVFIQTDQSLRKSWLGHAQTGNGLGYVSTGNWKTKCVQYLIKGRRRTADGFEDGWRVEVYPAMTPTAEPTKESETDSVDGVDPIQWTMAVQAVESGIYKVAGKGTAFAEFEVWGEQAKAFEEKMESGLFIMLPDTVIGEGVTLVAPTIEDVQTATHGGNDGTVVLPTTLKNSKDEDVAVTSKIQNESLEPAVNGSLAPATYTAIFSADGYTDVSATFEVTDKPE
jgi:hypothetical protein